VELTTESDELLIIGRRHKGWCALAAPGPVMWASPSVQLTLGKGVDRQLRQS
jgi:hypothetical protein